MRFAVNIRNKNGNIIGCYFHIINYSINYIHHACFFIDIYIDFLQFN